MDLPQAEFLTYQQAAAAAEEFLAEHGASDEIPVNIELIAERDLGLEVIPLPSLETALDTVGWLALDRLRVYVDQDVMLTNPNRYRFTLAHEIGHLILHRPALEVLSASVRTFDDWYRYHLDLDPWFEKQADWFAGVVLVPEARLLVEYGNNLACLQQPGIDDIRLSPYSRSVIAGRIARVFQVSTPVVEIRLRNLGL